MKRFLLSVLGICWWCCAVAQSYRMNLRITGDAAPLQGRVALSLADTSWHVLLSDSTDRKGRYRSPLLKPGRYYLLLDVPGYEPRQDSFRIRDSDVSLGLVSLQVSGNLLREVKVRLQEMQQRDDTLEYSASGFKVSEDASAAELVRKMPGIVQEGTNLKAQGETVLRVLVDGKPFFGDDALATLKNLPAGIVGKVQVYNEKSEQERFSGFTEGPGAKTINIVTRKGHHKGVFGKAYAGYGPDHSGQQVYTGGVSANYFAGERRLGLTVQQNNVNGQYFGDDGNSLIANNKNAGVAESGSAGLTYSDRLGQKGEMSASYYFNRSATAQELRLERVYVLPGDSGQRYREQRHFDGRNNNHAINTRLRYELDSTTTLQWQAQLSRSNNDQWGTAYGTTSRQGRELNDMLSSNRSAAEGLNLNSNVLLLHRFAKRGRTLSANLGWNLQQSEQDNRYQVDNSFPGSVLPDESIDQRSLQNQDNRQLSAELQLTEALGKRAMLKGQYAFSNRLSNADRNTLDLAAGSGAHQDSLLSGGLDSRLLVQRTGVSYQLRLDRVEYMAGLNYQFSRQRNEPDWRTPALVQDFNNLLLNSMIQYRFSSSRHLRLTFNTSTQNPGVLQLQEAVNNTNPLQLSTGNPALKQAAQYQAGLQYQAMNRAQGSQLSLSLRGSLTRNYITNVSVIALQDTTVLRGIFLARGAQLSYPVNLQGYAMMHGNITYALPLSALKSNLNMNLSGSLSRVPGIVNGAENLQQNRNLSLGINFSSNISEHVDFMLSTTTNLVFNRNSLNTALDRQYRNQALSGYLNLQLPFGLIFTTALSYQANAGLTGDNNQDYLLWNVGAGFRFLKHKRGDLRITVFDLLNRNRNISFQVTQIYEETSYANNLQRYGMLTFTYKISAF